ncbi:hypothetical protein [Halocella sp. SP3-1]|uniref:hypothetical protein n=1 Tax=Halocella sp. SP3-1 TaxID=2382161 RepID=UPI000F74C551|nr:hypothetical protein [Halocella sp. SP3-1]AZO94616.1 hypothetical protein D7D81_08435 [Halocella sp. SP3-1]
MKWQDVRKLYPDQFVKIEVLDSHTERRKQFVDDVAVIEPVNESNATKELLNSKNNTLVYHTSKENIVLEIRDGLGLRRVIQ